MKRFLLAGGIALGIVACYLTLRWISWLAGPRPQYPVYPHVQRAIMHPESQRLEFHTRDSAAQVREFYTATLLGDRWRLARDVPDRLVFERFWANFERREELTVALWAYASPPLVTGTVSYRTEPFYPCVSPDMC